MRYFFDMDGTICEYKFTTIDAFYEEGFFRDLHPFFNIINTIKELNRQGNEIYIVSKIIDSPYAINDKNTWLDKYLPEIDMAHRIFVPYNDSKIEHIPNGLSIDDYLIDDYNPNLFEWIEAGGNAIKIINGVNSAGSWIKDNPERKTMHVDAPAFINLHDLI